ncbi:hypothetical protein QJS10_CPB18g01092 [Acorus calamus]|uniref:Elongation factor Ts, mitochondrial n=1 Tax=Acorus calamus TaxID=4465 RepID=A0AAV9CMU8_ACOCL|nr:hypothetical protein QJS10_CPB18g01092 [Acorus calamus]
MPLTVEDEIALVVSENVPSIPDENGSVISSGETNGAPQESAIKAQLYGFLPLCSDISDSYDACNSVTISPALVKQLHEETGVGMMDCKKALSKTGGDIAKAQEFLRKKA